MFVACLSTFTAAKKRQFQKTWLKGACSRIGWHVPSGALKAQARFHAPLCSSQSLGPIQCLLKAAGGDCQYPAEILGKLLYFSDVQCYGLENAEGPCKMLVRMNMNRLLIMVFGILLTIDTQ